MKLKSLLQQIFADAEKVGVSRGELVSRAGLHQPAISRAISKGDCTFSTLNKLLEAGGFKLVVVKDDEEAERLVRGELF